MNQNNKIRKIKEANYNTPPVNIEPWVNPFLRLSDNEVLNKILQNGLSPPGASNEPITSSTGSVRESFPYSNQEGDVIVDGDPGNNTGAMNNPINIDNPGQPVPSITTPPSGNEATDPVRPPRDGGGDRPLRRRGRDAITAPLPSYTEGSPNLQAQIVAWQTNNDPSVVPDVAQILNRIPRISVGANDDVSFMVGQPDTLVVHYQNGDYQTFTFGSGRMVSANDRSRNAPRSDGRSGSGGPEFLTQSETPRYPSRRTPP